MVIGLLVVITLGLIALAAYLQRAVPDEVSPTAAKRVQQRIAPAGAVYAGATGASAQAAAQAAALAKAASQSAYGGTTDGKTIFNNLCTALPHHGCRQGADARPLALGCTHRPGQGHLVQARDRGLCRAGWRHHAPKGGNPGLTEEQVRATVDWMLGNLK